MLVQEVHVDFFVGGFTSGGPNGSTCFIISSLPGLSLKQSSEVMDGFGLRFNFTVFIGAWLSKQVRNRSLKAFTFPSTDSITHPTVFQGI